MRVRTTGFAVLVSGILIGAGGCSADSPTTPLAPAEASHIKGGYSGSGSSVEVPTSTTRGGGYSGSGSYVEESAPPVSAFGGYSGSGS